MAAKYRERLAASSGVCSNKAFESDFGKKILLKYGWQEGQGLGRLRDGRTDCIQAKRRELKTGLGAEKRKATDDAWDNWWADCFNSAAKKAAITRKSEEGEDASSDSSDDEGSRPEGGRITAVKKAGVMAGKLRRVLRQETPAVPK
eukprot:TRINITY_DN822_c0_g4_i1.p1 TRINITY_DN822_c0_g4~~TRINITY_DN822_c0_g4_i1.p1  ORF type:complete len:146 (+),score=46.36 TRINITY_DN822_c0_g4_i1:91-528(+)